MVDEWILNRFRLTSRLIQLLGTPFIPKYRWNWIAEHVLIEGERCKSCKTINIKIYGNSNEFYSFLFLSFEMMRTNTKLQLNYMQMKMKGGYGFHIQPNKTMRCIYIFIFTWKRINEPNIFECAVIHIKINIRIFVRWPNSPFSTVNGWKIPNFKSAHVPFIMSENGE